MRVDGLFDFIGSALDDVTAEFKRRGEAFISAHDALQARLPFAQATGRAPEYAPVLAQAARVRSGVEAAAAALRSALEYAGIESAADLRGLGAGPLIPVAIISGAIAATVGVYETMQFLINRDNQAFQKWCQENKVNCPAAPPGVAESVASAAMWGVLGVAAVLALPALLKGRR